MSGSDIAAKKVRPPPGGYQTYAFSDEEVLRRSYSYTSMDRYGTPPQSPRNRPAKKMNCESPNRSSMKQIITHNPQTQDLRKKSFRVAPGGPTSIEECFNLA